MTDFSQYTDDEIRAFAANPKQASTAMSATEYSDEELLEAAGIPVQKPASPGKAIWEGTKRESGRIKSGVQDMFHFGQQAFSDQPFEKSQPRLDIQNKEALAEAVYGEKVRENPGFGFAGRMAPYVPFPLGRSRAGALSYGALSGILPYTPSPSEKAASVGLGASLGMLGRELPSLINPNTRDAARRGFQFADSQVWPGGVSGEGLRRKGIPHRNRMANIFDNNVDVITDEALDIVGQPRGSYTSRTFQNVYENARNNFNDATTGLENVYFDNDFGDFLVDLGRREADRIHSSPEAQSAIRQLDDIVWRNNNVIDSNRYQSLRSEITDDIRGTDDHAVRRVLGEIVEALDDTAERSVSPDKMEAFQNARQSWRDMLLFEEPGVVRDGKVDPDALFRTINRRSGNELLRGQQPNDLRYDPLYGMLNHMQDQPNIGGSVDVANILRNTGTANRRLGPGVMYPFSKMKEMATRLPVTGIENLPRALSIPAIPTMYPPGQVPTMDLESLKRNK